MPASLGLPAHGIEDFRRTHEQAQAAKAVGLACIGRTLAAVSFGDQGVAIVSLLAKDMDTTRQWGRDVIGPLARNDDNTAEPRRTLHAFQQRHGNPQALGGPQLSLPPTPAARSQSRLRRTPPASRCRALPFRTQSPN